MCGIAGIVDLAGQPVDPGALVAMVKATLHRGPDDGGYVLIDPATGTIDSFAAHDSPESVREQLGVLEMATEAKTASVGLGHRRFSIIDLSAAGHQPFVSTDGTYCLVYNGELYNYVELREQLAASGVTFRSQSDTEVVLEAYRKWGPDCFAKFNGFWALALFDGRSGELILSRDRLGKKPLYWCRHGSRVYFGSEIKSLLAVPEVRGAKTLNHHTAWYWCALGLREINTDTFFAGIASLPAGSWCTVDHSFPARIRHYWSFPDSRLSEQELSVEEATRQVRDTLADAVRIRLRADVPLAHLLSGGLDSSAILALMAQNHPETITTYTIEYGDERWNEEPFAREVAQHYNVEYRTVEPPMDQFWQHLVPFFNLVEEPFHSPHMLTSVGIWAAMRDEGIKVTFHGSAGDELFAGYRKYYAPAQKDNLKAGRLGEFLDNALN